MHEICGERKTKTFDKVGKMLLLCKKNLKIRMYEEKSRIGVGSVGIPDVVQ